MDRTALTKLWDEFWESGLFAAPWSKAIDVTPEQAAWSPVPGRKSIWQIVNHVIFWRTYVLDRARGGPQLTPEEIERRNWEPPTAVTPEAWRQTRTRLRDSHTRLREAVADPGTTLDRIQYMLPHDAYHLGQIMYVRALQGLPVIE
jgi:hypothetical protein